MTDKISKELTKFNNKERALVREILLQIQQGDTKGLQITKLKGHKDIYRIRKRQLRIIYQQRETAVRILAIERRSEKTYKDFY
jgi:mRNA-degrading endonuclease RelE of RelBE toxin-antitoxin system